MDAATSVLLPDLSDDEPAGLDLEFDPDFIELDRLSQGKPEQQYGSTLVAAEEPDWKAMEAAARSLIERTYDLRVLVHLAVARLHRSGLDGYAETVGQIRSLLRTRWSAVHPRLDPDDDNDPTLRANALLGLGEPARVIRLLRVLPLARSPRAGVVTWREVGIANGTIEASHDAAKLTLPMIAAAFRETDAGALETLRTALNTAIDELKGIGAAFDAEAGFGTGPNLDDLGKLLRELAAIVTAHAPSGTVAADGASDELPEPEAISGAATTEAPSRPAVPVFSIASMGPPTNRADALRLLDLVVEFYARYEPSSPLPLLIGRARRLAELSFMDILRDMAPDGVSQAERIAGPPPT